MRLALRSRTAVYSGWLDIATSTRSTVRRSAPRRPAGRASTRAAIISRVRSTELATSRSASSRSVVRFSSVKKLLSAVGTLSAA